MLWGTLISSPPNTHTAVIVVVLLVRTAVVISSAPPPKTHVAFISAGTVHAPLRSKPPKTASMLLFEPSALSPRTTTPEPTDGVTAEPGTCGTLIVPGGTGRPARIGTSSA